MPQTAAMILSGDLGHLDPEWCGWSLRAGKLISPEGWEAAPGDVLSIQLLRAQLAGYQAKEREVAHMEDSWAALLPGFRA
jgi:hypothetical protein